MTEEVKIQDEVHQELSPDHHDPLIRSLHVMIRICVRLLAVLMVLVIALGVVDVCYVLYQGLTNEPLLLLDVSDIFAVFGAFMVVLIAITTGRLHWKVAFALKNIAWRPTTRPRPAHQL